MGKKKKKSNLVWQHITEKIPPNDGHPVMVAVRRESREYISENKYTLHIMPGWSARTEAKMNLDLEKRKGLSWDRKWVWWMPTEQPPYKKGIAK